MALTLHFGNKPFMGVYDVQNDFGATGDGVTDDTAAIQAAIDTAAPFTIGGGSLGRPVLFPVGQYLISSPINKRNVPIRGIVRGSYLVADPGWTAPGLHMMRNWDQSDYTGGETDYTLAPAHTGLSRSEGATYYHQIDGLSFSLGAVPNLRGLGIVHLHETSRIGNFTFGVPGTGAVGMDLQGNLDSTGTLNGNVLVENVTNYGIGWTNELLVNAGGSGLIVNNWTSAPGYHQGCPIDVTLIDFTLNNFRSEALVDPALAANTDLAVIRLRTCKNAFINNPTYNVDAGLTAEHPFVYGDNSHGVGFADLFLVRDLRMLILGTHDAAVPLLKDRTQSSRPIDIMYTTSQNWMTYDPTSYGQVNGNTGLGAQQSLNDFVVLAYGSTMTPDMAKGSSKSVTITSAVALAFNAPINAFTGQVLTLMIINSNAGAHGTITMNAAYKLQGGGSTLAATGGLKRRVFQFLYDGTNWNQLPGGVDIG